MTLFSKILVPSDFSEHAMFAVDYALELARRYNASITLVHVHDVVLYTLPDGLMLYPAVAMAELDTTLHTKLRLLKESLEQRDFPRVDTELARGPAAPGIVRCAAEGGYDLIVLGTHGRTGIAHALIGSVAERVVRTAPCPVLTIRYGNTHGNAQTSAHKGAQL